MRGVQVPDAVAGETATPLATTIVLDVLEDTGVCVCGGVLFYQCLLYQSTLRAAFPRILV